MSTSQPKLIDWTEKADFLLSSSSAFVCLLLFYSFHFKGRPCFWVWAHMFLRADLIWLPLLLTYLSLTWKDKQTLKPDSESHCQFFFPSCVSSCIISRPCSLSLKGKRNYLGLFARTRCSRLVLLHLWCHFPLGTTGVIRSVSAGRPLKTENATLTFSGCFPLACDTSLSLKKK